MKTYTFKVIIEADDDRWTAYAPALVSKGGATWGYTREEATKNIQEVIQMVIETLIEDGVPIPTEPDDTVTVTEEPLVSVIA